MTPQSTLVCLGPCCCACNMCDTNSITDAGIVREGIQGESSDGVYSAGVSHNTRVHIHGLDVVRFVTALSIGLQKN